ncbi:hypothetical protein ABTB96_19425, partial [Acinetobacter baumannii]
GIGIAINVLRSLFVLHGLWSSRVIAVRALSDHSNFHMKTAKAMPKTCNYRKLCYPVTTTQEGP